MKSFLFTGIIICFFMIIKINAQEWVDISPSFDPPGDYVISGTFISAEEGWMFARTLKPLYHTEDSGVTWTVQIEEDSMRFSDIWFVDNMNGWAKVFDYYGGYPTVYWLVRTANGGNTWQEVSKPPDSAFYAITFIDSLTGFSGGENAVYRTIDGGESWQAQAIYSEVHFGLMDIYFIDEQHGWAVGGSSDEFDMGIILNTINGGETWQVNDHPSGLTGLGVYFTDTLHGYAVGSNPPIFSGVIKVTNDGGENWDTHYLDCSWLNDVVFTNDSTGWVVGDYGFLWYTEDWGSTWESVETGTNAHLNRIIFVENGSVGYIFGEDNTLLKYDGTTGLKPDDNVSPSMFILYQNYPNPFNAGTVITYELKKTTFINLTVYDLMGKEVVNLVNKEQTAGNYKVNWNGKNNLGEEVSSGIYFCQLNTGFSSRAQKMILIH